MQSGYQFALERGYDVAVQVDGDGQHDPRHIPVLLAHLRENPDINMVTGSRFLSRTGDGYRSSVSRRLGIRIFAGVLSLVTRPARHRSDLGLPDDRPARHRAVRPRLPARLPRGRGRADGATRTGSARCELPVQHARAPVGRLLDQLDAVGLLHDQGAAGGPRRAAARAPRGRGRRRRARRGGARRSDGRPHPDRRDRRDRRAVLPGLRARAAPAADGALRAAVAVRDRRAARARGLARPARASSPARSASPTRRRRCSRSRSGSSCCCCCTSRS